MTWEALLNYNNQYYFLHFHFVNALNGSPKANL